MVRKLKINEQHRRILKCLARGDSTSNVLEFTGLNKHNYYKKTRVLEKYGYLTRKKVGRHLTFEIQPKGIKELTILSTGGQKVNYQDKINLHNVWVACPILKKPKEWKAGFVEKILESKSTDYRINRLKYWRGIYFDYASVKVRVTPNKILFNPPQIEISRNDSPTHAKNIMLRYIEGVIPKIERWFNVSLSKPDKISMSISSQHIAFVNNVIAKYFVDRGVNVCIYDKNNERRIIVDRSRGEELECINKKHAEEDAEKLKTLMFDVVTGKFDHEKIQANLNAVVDNQLIFSQNLRSHVSAIKGLNKGIKKLNDLLDQLKERRFY